MVVECSILEYIRVTAEYSNAVLLATLPYVTDFSQKLDLPLPAPVTTNHVRSFFTDPHRGRILDSIVHMRFGICKTRTISDASMAH
jgi:hypothetical protein